MYNTLNSKTRQMSYIQWVQHISSNLICQAKYCVQICFSYTLVYLSLVNNLSLYHALLSVALYFYLQLFPWIRWLPVLKSKLFKEI